MKSEEDIEAYRAEVPEVWMGIFDEVKKEKES